MMTRRMLVGTHECLLCVAMQGLSSTAIHIYGNKKEDEEEGKRPSLKSWSLILFDFFHQGRLKIAAKSNNH